MRKQYHFRPSAVGLRAWDVILGQSHIRAVRFLTDPKPDFVGVDPDDLPYEEESDQSTKREV